MSEIPLVQFGKYKNKPVTHMLKDVNYLEWCKNQPGLLQQFPVIYNIVYNIDNTENNNKTPAHNKIQNLFLDSPYRFSLLDAIHCGHLSNINNNLTNMCSDEKIKPFIKDNFDISFDLSDSVEFESQFGWDLFVKYKLDFKKHMESNKLPFDCAVDYLTQYNQLSYNINKGSTKYHDVVFNTLCQFVQKTVNSFNLNYLVDVDVNASMAVNTDDGIEISPYLNNHLVFCEIKPVLGDDYPCVLRKMKQQIGLTQVSFSKNKNNFSSYVKHYVLLVDQFNSDVTSKEQLVQIFKQTNICVVFLHQIM